MTDARFSGNTEGLGQIKQEGISPLSPSLKSLEGKNTWRCPDCCGLGCVHCNDTGALPVVFPEQSSGVQTPGNSNGGKGEPVAWLRSSGTGSPVITEEFLKCYPQHRGDFEIPLYLADGAKQ